MVMNGVKREAGFVWGAVSLKALFALAMLSYGLMVWFPQDAEPLTSNAFTVPAADAATIATAQPRQDRKRS